jgi:hypothetical protein
MYRALPTDMTHPDYQMYRRGIGSAVEIGSLAAGGYGLFKGGVKAAKWASNAWKLKQGTFVAAEKLVGFKGTNSLIKSPRLSLVRDRKTINCAFIEEKNGSDLEDFLEAGIASIPVRENPQEMNRFFPREMHSLLSYDP